MKILALSKHMGWFFPMLEPILRPSWASSPLSSSCSSGTFQRQTTNCVLLSHVSSSKHHYPLVICYIAIEHGHRNSWFTYEKWWFSMVMLVYQRVKCFQHIHTWYYTTLHCTIQYITDSTHICSRFSCFNQPQSWKQHHQHHHFPVASGTMGSAQSCCAPADAADVADVAVEEALPPLTATTLSLPKHPALPAEPCPESAETLGSPGSPDRASPKAALEKMMSGSHTEAMASTYTTRHISILLRIYYYYMFII